VSGNVEAAIPVLERAEYADDAVAKLVHAECLAFAQRYEDAIEMYDRAATLAPARRAKAIAGKVHALLALERAAEAIAVLDTERDLDADLVELRALALHRLGATDDADRELARVIAASGNRSALRLGR
jgi:tetratricopeptide (TPR) repeat protein